MTDEASSDCGDLPLTTLLAEAASTLAAAGVQASRREARMLAAHALGLDSGEIMLLRQDHPVPAARFRRLLARRAAREPMAFITGACGFWTLDLEVSPVTLIPRADTETLIQAALALRPERARVRTVLDLGCGTGALLLAALAEHPSAFGVGVDRSVAACRLARANGVRNGLAARAIIVCGDWAGMLAGPDARFDLVLCNPPYVATVEIGELMPEVAAHEPRLALDGGADGLASYRALLPELGRVLAPSGLAVLEIGAGQEEAVLSHALTCDLALAGRRRDLEGVVRALAFEAR